VNLANELFKITFYKFLLDHFFQIHLMVIL